jgi:tryptophanyl-tRNA synthetase
MVPISQQLTGTMADSAALNSRPRVLSGMRPTGKLHLGNYMGALHNWVKLQDGGQYECYFFIADWHALTTDYANPGRVKLNTLDVALDWLAAGLDPEKSVIFIQSHVLQHAELHLLFSMITPLGWLERVPTYKEQQENITGKDLSTYGFLGYPLLQAADILMYQAEYVPVGQDQVAHVELTREVARRFNSMYKTTVFPEPEALLTPSPKLTGTDGRKMSKSYGNTIGLSESPLLVGKKIVEMSTGGQRVQQSDAGDPDVCPVGQLHKAFSSPEMVAETHHGCRTATIRCEFCKIKAAQSVTAVTTPIYYKRQELEARIDDTWEMLRAQSAKASERAEQTMVAVRSVFDLSHDIGSVRRYFGYSAKDSRDPRDLSEYSEWWSLPTDQRSAQLREYWRNNLVPRDVALSQESNRVFTSIERELEEPFLSEKKKRVFVTTAREKAEGDWWEFEVPARSYEVWVLLCWRDADRMLVDFSVPQKVFSADFASAKKSAAKGEKIPVTVRRTPDNRFSLSIAGKAAQDITDLKNNYDPLK